MVQKAITIGLIEKTTANTNVVRGTVPNSSRDLLPSSTRYRLVRCIAVGGMGEVYLGVQRGAAGFARTVAIKRAKAHLLADPNAREAILAEARNGSLVRHPNVVSIDDVEEVDGELLLVMDYVDGLSLGGLMTPGVPISIGVVLRVILDVCAGLSAIHSATDHEGQPLGLVHRDVSPQNILVGLDGVARITDFGIAKGVNDRARTGPSMRRGKLGYMAPEYIAHRTNSARSDMFALGVVLWEALAGRRLFEGKSGLDSVRLAAAAEVPSLCPLNPEVSPELDAIIRTALAKSPEARFQDLHELEMALESVVRGHVASRPQVAKLVAMARTKAPTESESGVVMIKDPLSSSSSSSSSPQQQQQESSGVRPNPETLTSSVLIEDGTSDVFTFELEVLMPSLRPAASVSAARSGTVLASSVPRARGTSIIFERTLRRSG